MSESNQQQLHSIVVWLVDQPGVLQYVFRSREAALIEYKQASESIAASIPVLLRDDFGRELSAARNNVQAIQLVDVAAELNGQIELKILQAHAEMKLQKRAQQDAMLNNRPAIVPAGMNGPLPFPPRQN